MSNANSGHRWTMLAGVLAYFAASTAPMAAKVPVDLELVIATDVSYSIDEGEALLQRQGIAEAFRSKQVIRAIRSGFLRRIAVAYVDYSSRAFNRVVIDWRVIEGRASAEAFAADLLNSSLTTGRRTSISDAVELAAEMIETNDLEGTRRVIDVSGDGPNNYGRLVDDVRDATIARRITINGLPIMNKNDEFSSRYYLADLDLYYRGCVIGGPGAFLVVANNFVDYARAIRRKLILEIAGLTPPPDWRPRAMVIKATSHTRARPSPSGYVYPKGCDIGEQMRNYGED
ncbi:MAG: DUF1194 domain-containing protein [Alphaproteobacteria bacterium]